MKNRLYLGIIFLGLSALFFQNFTEVRSGDLNKNYNGGLGGIERFSEGLMVWGFACKKNNRLPVDVSIYFTFNNSRSELWKVIKANQKNTASQSEITQLCGTRGVAHEFKVHIPYEDALKFNGATVSAYIVDGQNRIPLGKYSDYSDQLRTDPKIVYTKYGWIEGEEINKIFPMSTNVISFKGVPYAAVPIGHLRWAASVPPKPWMDSKITKEFGSPCIQEEEHYKLLNTSIPQSEDCLYLNVWKPINKVKKPVLVYIHGGQFKGGWSGIKDYDGAYIASQDIVFVSFNYRVGIMGFFSHPHFKGKRGNVNFGLTDQELALKWVKDNIAEFGGDPENITIMGSSAGGASVGYWMSNQQGEGLFHRAIMESGGGLFTKWLNSKDIAEQRGQDLTDELHKGKGSCSDQCIENLLFNTPVSVLKNTNIFNRVDKSGAKFEIHPYLDYKYVVGGTLDVFRCGMQKDIPFIVGSMGWEANIVEQIIKGQGNSLSGPMNYLKKQGFLSTTKLESKYKIKINNSVERARLLSERFYGDKTFAVPARILARLHSKKNKSFLYFFNYVGKEMPYTKGATHQLLSPFIFRSLDTTNIGKKAFGSSYVPSQRDRFVASVWSGYWQNFVKNKIDDHGIAGINGLKWSNYESQEDNRLMVQHFGHLLAGEAEQREFGGVQTYEYDRLLSERYNYIEENFYKKEHFYKIPIDSDTSNDDHFYDYFKGCE